MVPNGIKWYRGTWLKLLRDKKLIHIWKNDNFDEF